MNIITKLTLRHLAMNRRRTAITVIGIALSIAMVTAISGFILSFQDLLYRDSVAKGGLWHVRYHNLSESTAAALVTEPVFSAFTEERGGEGIILSLQFAKLDRGIFDRSEEICFRYGIGQEQVRYHNNLLIAKGLVPGNYYESLYSFAAVLIALVAAASVMVIGNAFSISASERSRQFGLLKSVGATAAQIRGTVLCEGLVLLAFAIPAGIAAGLLTEWGALSIANHILGGIEAVQIEADFRVVLSGWVLLTAAGAALVTVLLAAWLPAGRAARVSAIEAIRQTTEVRVRPRDVRSPRLIGKLFGFEGTLAAKTMRRSRRGYRATVISLVVSIVLFIGVSSFGEMLLKASGMVYQDYGSNVLVRLHGEDKARQDRLAGEISRWEGVEAHPFRRLQFDIVLTEGQMTGIGLEMLGAGTKNLYLYSVSEERLAELCGQLGIPLAELEDTGEPGAILVNTTGTYIRAGRRHNFTPYRLSGQELTFAAGGEGKAVSVLGELREIPREFAIEFSANAVNLVISEAARASLNPRGMSDWLSLTVMVNDPDVFEDRVNEYLALEMEENTYTVLNYEASVENSRNIWLLIMIFVYGFIGLLSLIGVTNVVTTISTGMALRRREFATLRSMGMTQAGIAKSLRYESLIYALKSLLIGVPIGLGASVAMYYALGISLSFEYIWPVSGVIISVAAVLLLAYLTTGFAGRRQRGESIVDSLQNEIT